MGKSPPTLEECLDALRQANGNKAEAARALGISRSSLRTKVGLVKDANEPITLAEEHRLKREAKRLKAQLSEVTETAAKDGDILGLLRRLAGQQPTPPTWTAPKQHGRAERAIVTACLSDCHYDEVVRPEEVNWINGYDREIATARTRSFFDNVVRISRDYINGIHVEGLVMPMLGDMVSGNIHQELLETNEDRIVNTCLYYADLLIAGIRELAEHFDRIFIPCVVGNHGRFSRKPVAKGRPYDSFDYLLYHLVARAFTGSDQVAFAISDGADFRYPVYSTRYQLTHGDQFRGGSGISGMLSPLMLGDARKRKREGAVGTPYDYLVMGHWHQLAAFKGIIVNGSLKGYDEYAAISNFEFEPPQQALWLTDPNWGRTIMSPVHVLGEGESWRACEAQAVGF